MLIQIHQHAGNKVSVAQNSQNSLESEPQNNNYVCLCMNQTEIIEIPRLKTPAKLLEDEEKPEQHLRN